VSTLSSSAIVPATLGTRREDVIAAPCAWCGVPTFGRRFIDGDRLGTIHWSNQKT
jgi:hypothetical protein